jgi:ABC-2 type transport system ATP-binding protein
MTSSPTLPLAIELRGVSKRFDSSPPSLDGLALEVASGSVFGYLGTNGAGKTTTIRVLLGLVRPDAGHVRVLGMDPRLDGARIRAQVGVLLENDGLYDRLTAAQNLEFYARIVHLEGAARVRRVEEMLRSAGLWERREDRVATFSKGMRQKLAIARTLLGRPRLVLLDEPFTGLDPVAAADLRGSIAELARAQGTTVLLTTHDLAHVEKACDAIAVLRAGRIVASGTLEQLRATRSDVEVAVRGAGIDEPLLEAMKSAGAILSFVLDTDQGAAARVVCSHERRPRLGVDLVERGVVLEDLTTVRASLEDTFLALVSPPEISS